MRRRSAARVVAGFVTCLLSGCDDGRVGVGGRDLAGVDLAEEAPADLAVAPIHDFQLPERDLVPGLFDPDAACASASEQAVVEKLPVDIIWVVDNSISMAPAIQAVTDGLNAFAQLIGNKNLDYKIIVLSLRSKTNPIVFGGGQRYAVCIPPPLAGDGNCGNGPRFFQSSVDIRSTQPLEQILGTLGQTAGYRQGESRGGEPWLAELRPKATRTFVVVTDDNSRLSAGDFQTFPGGRSPFNANMLPPGILDPSWKGLFTGFLFSGIYGWDSINDPGARCRFMDGSQPPSPGLTYTTLIKQTGGVRAKICDGAKAWQPFFDAIATAVERTSELACDLAIPAPPMGVLDPGAVNVTIDDKGGSTVLPKVKDAGACGMAPGWYYDDPVAPKRVLLCPASCMKAQEGVKAGGTPIRIYFGCESVIG